MKRSSFLVQTLAIVATILPAAAGVPSGFTDNLLFSATIPTGLAYEPGSGNAFVLEKGNSGSARVRRRALSDGTVTTALTLSCVDHAGERGLLGIAFDPDYLLSPASRWVYLYYTQSATCAGSGPRNRVVRYLESGGTLSSEDPLLEGPTLSTATNHNGGTVRFAPDKTLFISMGDNADADSTPLARDLSDLRGKFLRINRDGSIPTDNPFVGQAGRRAEIWAWGLRNPFRFSIDPASGTPWIGDVGQSTWEEIDRGVKGADYGWPCYEGEVPYRTCDPPPADATPPVLVYPRSGSFSGGTVIGGPVYRGGDFPASYEGRLFFGDYVAGWIRSAAIGPGGNSLTDVQIFNDDAGNPVDLVQAPNGCIAYVDIGAGGVHEICCTSGCSGASDHDGDGFETDIDCNDNDPLIYPGSPDLCDGEDNDCDDGIDNATCAVFNGDGDAVNGFDLSLLGRFFGLCSLTPLGEPWADVEYTKDSCLDGDDLAVMTAVWGCSGSVPICP